MEAHALCSEMETEPCCEAHNDPGVTATESDVKEAIFGLVDGNSLNELPRAPAEEGEELFGSEQAETERSAAENKDTEIKSPSDPKQESGETGCKAVKKFKKSNSWKMVRFQDPSTEDDVLERDSSTESLFPEYATQEWTCTSFEELFMAEDWTEITGKIHYVLVVNPLKKNNELDFITFIYLI